MELMRAWSARPLLPDGPLLLGRAGLAAGVLLGSGVAAPPPAEAAPYCGITWGSYNQQMWETDNWSANTVESVRSGRHDCFDRLVIDVRGQINGYYVGYAPAVLGTNGKPIPLRGAADLEIFLTNPSVTKSGKLSWDMGNHRELVDVSGYRTFRQVALSGFGSENGAGRYGQENYTGLALGVRAHLPLRAFVLEGPGSGSRLVIDVAHRW